MQLKKTISYYNDISQKLSEQKYFLRECDDIRIFNRDELIYHLDGYPIKYDVRDDYAFQLNQDIFTTVSNTLRYLYGDPIEINNFFQNKCEEIRYEKWFLNDVSIYNYFFNNIKTGNNYTYLIISNE
ncbi:MAG: hypothetical protein HFI86_03150 [Bacilli bacterium]|nr:hypothetical protein [Bacilli bacterium]